MPGTPKLASTFSGAEGFSGEGGSQTSQSVFGMGQSGSSTSVFGSGGSGSFVFSSSAPTATGTSFAALAAQHGMERTSVELGQFSSEGDSSSQQGKLYMNKSHTNLIY